MQHMEFSEADHGCNKHSDQQGKQGVCPCCLRESLSRLSSVSYKEASTSRVATSLYSADYSLASPSNSASQTRRRNFRKRTGHGVMGIIGMSSSFRLKVGTINGLKKSRSIAFVPRNLDDDYDDDDDDEAEYGKHKKGFWSKLVHFKGKKDVLTHSTSTRVVIGRMN